MMVSMFTPTCFLIMFIFHPKIPLLTFEVRRSALRVTKPSQQTDEISKNISVLVGGGGADSREIIDALLRM